jgi:hypothetical protein
MDSIVGACAEDGGMGVVFRVHALTRRAGTCLSVNRKPEIQPRESSENLHPAYRRALQLANIRARSDLRLSSLLIDMY